jgi:hypothetical protein
MVTLRAELARRKGTFMGKNRFRTTVTRGPRIARTVQEGKMDMTDPGARWPRYMLKGRTSTTYGVREWKSKQPRLKNEKTINEIYRKIIRLELGKRIARSSVTLWKMCNRPTLRSLPPLERKVKEWTLWRGRPPPKRLKS